MFADSVRFCGAANATAPVPTDAGTDRLAILESGVPSLAADHSSALAFVGSVMASAKRHSMPVRA